MCQRYRDHWPRFIPADSLFDQDLALKAREREPKTLEEARNNVVRLEAYASARIDDTT